jgi:hypothetical protein
MTFVSQTGVCGLLVPTLPTLPLLVAEVSFSFGEREERIVAIDLRVHGHPAHVKLSLKKALRLCSDWSGTPGIYGTLQALAAI